MVGLGGVFEPGSETGSGVGSQGSRRKQDAGLPFESWASASSIEVFRPKKERDLSLTLDQRLDLGGAEERAASGTLTVKE